MNVPNIGQGPGGVTAPPWAQTGGDPAVASRADASNDAAPEPEVTFTRLAWFDVNGDGDIDPRSATAGGDATLLVPAHAVDLPTYARKVHTVGDLRAFRLKDQPSGTSAAVPNSAQTRQALDAYQRYGQATPHSATPAPDSAPDRNASSLEPLATVIPPPPPTTTTITAATVTAAPDGTGQELSAPAPAVHAA